MGPKGMPVVRSPLSKAAATIRQEIPTSPSAPRNDRFVRFVFLMTKTDNHNGWISYEAYIPTWLTRWGSWRRCALPFGEGAPERGRERYACARVRQPSLACTALFRQPFRAATFPGGEGADSQNDYLPDSGMLPKFISRFV